MRALCKLNSARWKARLEVNHCKSLDKCPDLANILTEELFSNRIHRRTRFGRKPRSENIFAGDSSALHKPVLHVSRLISAAVAAFFGSARSTLIAGPRSAAIAQNLNCSRLTVPIIERSFKRSLKRYSAERMATHRTDRAACEFPSLSLKRSHARTYKLEL